MQFLKRKVGRKDGRKELQAPMDAIDASFAKKYPALSEFLTETEWEPGVERTRGTLLIFFEDSCFKACLSDRDSGNVAFVSKGTFTGLMDSVEKGLAADNLDWRLSSYAKGKAGKKA